MSTGLPAGYGEEDSRPRQVARRTRNGRCGRLTLARMGSRDLTGNVPGSAKNVAGPTDGFHVKRLGVITMVIHLRAITAVVAKPPLDRRERTFRHRSADHAIRLRYERPTMLHAGLAVVLVGSGREILVAMTTAIHPGERSPYVSVGALGSAADGPWRRLTPHAAFSLDRVR